MKPTIFLIGLLWCTSAAAQISLIGSPYVQDFNTGTLPPGWSVRTGATAVSIGTSVTFNAGQTSWTSATGNFRNVASATGLKATSTLTEQSASLNRAMGLRQTGTFGDPGAAFVFQLSNTAGWANFVMRFKLQSLDASSSGRTINWRVDYAIGASPTAFNTIATTPASPTTSLGAAAWGSQDVEINFADAIDDQAGTVWIRVVTLVASAGTGSRPTSAIDDVELSFTPADKTPPLFVSDPTLSNITPSGLDLTGTLDEDGSLYFVILSDADVAPSAAQVRIGQNGVGMVVPLAQQGNLIMAAHQSNSRTINTLRGATDYKIYLVAEDKHHNLQSTTITLAFRTLDPPDVLPPVWDVDFPMLNQIDADQIKFSASLDEPAKLFFLVVQEGHVEPTASQLLTQTPVEVPVAHETVVVTQNGLAPATAYKLYLLSEDRYGNIQSKPLVLSFVTGNRYIENFDEPENEWSFRRYSLDGDQDWYSMEWMTGNKAAQINGFDGTPLANEDWLMSPLLRLSDRATLSFSSRYSFSGSPLVLRMSTSVDARPGSPGWIDVPFDGPPSATPLKSKLISDWTQSVVDLSAYAGKQIRVAFVYTSSLLTARAWALDSIRMDNVTAHYFQTGDGQLILNNSLTPQPITWQGVGISQPTIIKSPVGFALSRDGITYADSLVVAKDQSLTAQIVWVKHKPVSPDEVRGVMELRSGNVTATVDLLARSMEETFDVATYNLEFFGSNVTSTTGQEFGPTNDTLQVSNVARVINALGSDFIALQEISDRAALDKLMKSFPRYRSILSNRWSHSTDPPDPNFPPQQIGLLYDTTTVEVINTQALFLKLYDDIRAGKFILSGYPGGSTGLWSSGRLPFMSTIRVKIRQDMRTLRVINVHAKSGAARTDHDRRRYDVGMLYDSLRRYYADASVVILGDFNDEVTNSITPGANSPYQPFVDDTVHYAVLTRSREGYTYPATRGWIDHIIVSRDLMPSYLNNSVRVEDARTYLTNYTTTTSDHLPVMARFWLARRPQQIMVSPVPTLTYGDRPIRIQASSTSALPVEATSLDTARLLIRRDSLFIRSAGTVTVRFSQPGNARFGPAEVVELVLLIRQSPQQLQVSQVEDKTMGDADFFVHAFTSSGLPVLVKAVTSNVMINADNTIHLAGAGPAIVSVTQPGNNNYTAALSIQRSFCIRPPRPKISVLAGQAPEFILVSSADNGNQWYFRGTPIAGATGSRFATHTPGNYSVQATIGNCASTFAEDVVLAINGIEASRHVSVYPNPASDGLRVTGMDEGGIRIYDMSGKEWETGVSQDVEGLIVQVGSLPPGNYVLVGTHQSGIHVVRFTRSP
jgi:endonuclease/exonuclease/phosphatase family metal-dependent hydrolase